MKYEKPTIEATGNAQELVLSGEKNEETVPDTFPDIRVHSQLAYQADE